MEVGQQPVDTRDAITRKNENLRLTGKGVQLTIAGSAFERTHDRCTHGNDASTRCAGAANLLHQARTDIEPLAVHMMILDVVRAYRLKRACSDMQGDITEVHALPAQARQHRFVEVQPSGWCG